MRSKRRTAVYAILGVVALRLAVELASWFHLHPGGWQATFAQAYLGLAVQLAADVAGGVLYALLVRRRANLTLGDFALGGAIVGFLANLISAAISDALLALLIIYWHADSTLRSVVTCAGVLNAVLYPILGILLGGIGGGAVGLLQALRSIRQRT